MTVWAWAAVIATGAGAGAAAVQLQHGRIIRRHIDTIDRLNRKVTELNADVWAIRIFLAVHSDDVES